MKQKKRRKHTYWCPACRAIADPSNVDQYLRHRTCGSEVQTKWLVDPMRYWMEHGRGPRSIHNPRNREENKTPDETSRGEGILPSGSGGT